MSGTLFTEISELLTNSPLQKENRFTHIQREDLGITENAWMAVCDNGRVLETGSGTPPEKYSDFFEFSLDGYAVMPGLIDSHTHPVFGGERDQEFAMRLDGTSYQDIANAGGGIKASVEGTRKASDEKLTKQIKKFLDKCLTHGVTTIEAKSGYGLSPKEEIRQLRLLKKVNQTSVIEIVPTLLALHALPLEFDSAKEYADDCEKNILPLVAKENLARFVDMFIEDGYFSPSDCKSFTEKALELGLKLKVHADEFSDSGAADFAATHKAVSADHLQSASHESLKKMAQNDVVACLLPGTSLYTNIPFTKAAPIREAGCPMAIASDYNPGSCYLPNLPLIASMAGLHCKMTSAEVLAGVTWVAAKALDLTSKKGALTKNLDADFIVVPFKKIDQWLADCGQSYVLDVFIKGRKMSHSFEE